MPSLTVAVAASPPAGKGDVPAVIEDPGGILRRRREERGLTLEQVIAEVGIPTITQLSQYERGKVSIARSKYLPALARFLGLTEEEVRSINPSAVFDLTAVGSSSTDPVSTLQHFIRSDTLESLTYTMLPIFDLAHASRPISELEPLPDTPPVAVPTKDLKPGTVLFRVRGDSMTIAGQNGIMEGDTIYVATHDLALQSEGVFVISIPGDGVTLKRVRDLGGEFWLFSDNEDQARHPPFRVDSARVVGRVYKATRDLPLRL